MAILTLLLLGSAASVSANFIMSHSEDEILLDTLQLESSLQQLGAGTDLEEDKIGMAGLISKAKSDNGATTQPANKMNAFAAAMNQKKSNPANANPATPPKAKSSAEMAGTGVKKDGLQTKCADNMMSQYKVCKMIHDHVSSSCAKAIAVCGSGESWENDAAGPKDFKKSNKKKLSLWKKAQMDVKNVLGTTLWLAKLKPYKRQHKVLPLPGEKILTQTKIVKNFAESHSTQMCLTQAKALGVDPKDAPCNAIYQDGHVTLGLNNNSYWARNASVYGGENQQNPLVIDCLDNSVAETFPCDDAKYSHSSLIKACSDDVVQCPPPVRAEFRMEKAKNGKGQLNPITGSMWSLFLLDPPSEPFFNSRVFICSKAVMDTGVKATMENVYCDSSSELFTPYLQNADKHMPERYKVKRADLPWLPNDLTGDNQLNELHATQVAAGIHKSSAGGSDIKTLSTMQNDNPMQILHWTNLAPLPKGGMQDSKIGENKWIGDVGDPKPKPPPIDEDSDIPASAYPNLESLHKQALAIERLLQE